MYGFFVEYTTNGQAKRYVAIRRGAQYRIHAQNAHTPILENNLSAQAAYSRILRELRKENVTNFTLTRY